MTGELESVEVAPAATEPVPVARFVGSLDADVIVASLLDDEEVTVGIAATDGATVDVPATTTVAGVELDVDVVTVIGVETTVVVVAAGTVVTCVEYDTVVVVTGTDVVVTVVLVLAGELIGAVELPLDTGADEPLDTGALDEAVEEDDESKFDEAAVTSAVRIGVWPADDEEGSGTDCAGVVTDGDAGPELDDTEEFWSALARPLATPDPGADADDFGRLAGAVE